MRWSDRIARRIKLSDLHVLLAVANSGSMAKAAKELAVSHPVVSRSISELEQTLGVRQCARCRTHRRLTTIMRTTCPIGPRPANASSRSTRTAHGLVVCNFPPQAISLPSPRSAVCIIAMSVEPREIGEAVRPACPTQLPPFHF